MRNRCKIIAFSGMIICLLGSCQSVGEGFRQQEDLLTQQSDFQNLINIKNVPAQTRDYRSNVFSDLGAWSGYALPEKEGNQLQGAFIGPVIMNGRGWIAASLANPTIRVNGELYNLTRNVQTAKYHPGKLLQAFNDEQLHFTTELCFETSRTAVVRAVVKNVSNEPITFSIQWNGGVFDKNATLKMPDGNSVSFTREIDAAQTVIRFLTADKVMPIHNDSLQVIEKTDFVLQPNATYQANYIQTLVLQGEDIQKELAAIQAIDVNACFQSNTERWNKNLALVLNGDSKYLADNKYRKVIVKAMMTLNSNWRTPAGDLLHAGSYPSYNGFIGFWSWDSWKIASANALYNPEMAKDEMRTLFDYQAADGMIPDFISYNKARNNWRDTKPPIAAWGTMNVYKASPDEKFLEEMFDKLYKFHQWWYANRDHDHNGICEYGSTDGTLIAAAWESGMDNGVRFDDVIMLPNGDNAWSMNQENICLNSFLYVEKNILAEMATILDKKELAEQLANEAAQIKKHIQTKMFDKATGFFYDTRISTGEFIKVMGAECWLPLWAGIATPEQAKQVMKKMMDPNKFNATLPLGTLAVDHPSLRPTRGYWRGPVWVDQVYFGIVGLRNYGFDKEADYLLEKFIENAQGLTTDGPIHENYNPLTGETLNCPNFGWSSAVIIKMLLNK